MKPASQSFRFQPTLWAAIFHLLLMGAVFVLFLGRKPGPFRSGTLMEAVPGVYSHVFNFSLSYLLLAGVGFMWLMAGVAMRHVAWAALLLAAINIAYEGWLPLLNTRDPIDAVYGVLGALLGMGWLWLVRRFGLRAASSAVS